MISDFEPLISQHIMKATDRTLILFWHLLTLHVFTDEHPKVPPPEQGSEKEIFTETFRAFVNEVDAVI